MVRNPTIQRMTFLKKRVIPIALLSLFSFALGWVCVCFRVQTTADERIARFKEQQAYSIATLRQRIYGDNYFHNKEISPEDDKRLERFDPTDSKGYITLSYVGGMGGSDTHLKIECNGSVFVTDHGATRKVLTLDRNRCADFFKRVMTSGVLNYSDAVIELKVDLTTPTTRGGLLDAPETGFHISVPELEIEKKISICSPGSELKHNPDIIEFQLVAALEEEILSFIPKEDPFWK